MEDKIYDTGICERVRMIRELNHYSRPQFAELMGTNIYYIKSIETFRHVPHFEFLVRFKKQFNLKWDWIIEGKGKMQP